MAAKSYTADVSAAGGRAGHDRSSGGRLDVDSATSAGLDHTIDPTTLGGW